MTSKLIRTVLWTFVAVVVIDWSVKLAQPLLWGGWVVHDDEVALRRLPVVAVLALALLAMVRSRLAAVGAGLMIGGCAANLIDLAADGHVWNMIPVPLSGGYWCNVADFALVGGLAVCLLACFWRPRPAGHTTSEGWVWNTMHQSRLFQTRCTCGWQQHFYDDSGDERRYADAAIRRHLASGDRHSR